MEVRIEFKTCFKLMDKENDAEHDAERTLSFTVESESLPTRDTMNDLVRKYIEEAAAIKADSFPYPARAMTPDEVAEYRATQDETEH